MARRRGLAAAETMSNDMSASEDGKDGDAKLPVDKVRDLVDQIKSHEATQPHSDESRRM